MIDTQAAKGLMLYANRDKPDQSVCAQFDLANLCADLRICFVFAYTALSKNISEDTQEMAQARNAVLLRQKKKER